METSETTVGGQLMSTQTDLGAQLDIPPPEPEWLPAHLRAWEAAHIITPEQVAAIRKLEDAYAEPAESVFRYQRIIAIVSAFGGILLAAGLILLVGSNWADMPRLAKVAFAVGTVVGFEALGYGLRYHSEYRRIGATFLFVGAAAYGAAIMLVAQAYQYPVDDPNLLLLWFAPVLPLAYLVRSPMIAALGIAVGYAAVGYRAADWFELAPSSAGEFGWQVLYLAVGATVAALGYLHHRFGDNLKPMGRPYQWIGSLTVLVFLYLMSFEPWYDRGSAGWLDALPGEAWFMLVVSVVVTVGSAIGLLRSGAGDAKAAAAGIAVSAGVAYAMILTLFAQPAGAPMAPYLVTNLLLIGAQIGLVSVGVTTRQPALVNVSLAFFGLTVVTRYIEVSAGMFATGVSMMMGGALIIGLAWGLERLRRSLITRFELRGGS
jgi:uncharacterized membrane protein